MDLQTPSNLPIVEDEPGRTGLSSAPPVPPVPPAPVAAPASIPSPIQSMPSSMQPGADDMFSGVERAAPPLARTPAPSPVMPPVMPPVVTAPQTNFPTLPEAEHPPILHYLLIALAVVVVLGGIAGGVWYFAIRRPAQQVMETLPTAPIVTSSTTDLTEDVSNTVPTVPLDEPIDTGLAPGQPEAITAKPVVTPPVGANVPPPTSIDPNAQVPVVTPPTPATPVATDTSVMAPPVVPPIADQDKDGLSDARETELGTNPALADTDGDGLSDGDEVLKYHTNPLIPDTDADGFPDGVEVQKGYNPLGAGKCATPTCIL